MTTLNAIKGAILGGLIICSTLAAQAQSKTVTVGVIGSDDDIRVAKSIIERNALFPSSVQMGTVPGKENLNKISVTISGFVAQAMAETMTNAAITLDRPSSGNPSTNVVVKTSANLKCRTEVDLSSGKVSEMTNGDGNKEPAVACIIKVGPNGAENLK